MKMISAGYLDSRGGPFLLRNIAEQINPNQCWIEADYRERSYRVAA
jgi:hypothetical protein